MNTSTTIQTILFSTILVIIRFDYFIQFLLKFISLFQIKKKKGELKNQCDIKREEIKMEIDNHFDAMLQEIEDLSNEYQRGAKFKNSEKISSEIEQSKKNINDWIKDYDMTMIDEKTRDKIIFKSKFAKVKLDKELEILKRNLLKNKSFSISGNKSFDKRLLGSVKCEEVKLNFLKFNFH